MIAKIKEKTANALKVQETHDRNIDNIKSQVASPNLFYIYYFKAVKFISQKAPITCVNSTPEPTATKLSWIALIDLLGLI